MCLYLLIYDHELCLVSINLLNMFYVSKLADEAKFNGGNGIKCPHLVNKE